VGIFKRDLADGAARAIEDIVNQVAGATQLRAVGMTEIAGQGLPAISGQDFYRLAELSLAQALRTGRPIERLVLMHQGSNAGAMSGSVEAR
jgi:hypothetical protein